VCVVSRVVRRTVLRVHHTLYIQILKFKNKSFSHTFYREHTHTIYIYIIDGTSYFIVFRCTVLFNRVPDSNPYIHHFHRYTTFFFFLISRPRRLTRANYRVRRERKSKRGD
jgi:hypothetical protein